MAYTKSRRLADGIAVGYISITRNLLALGPSCGILALLFFADSYTSFQYNAFHQVSALLSVAIGLLLAKFANLGFRRTRSRLFHHISLGFLTYAILYSPNGLLTGLIPDDSGLFNLFGPLARLVMNVYLLTGLVGSASLYERIPKAFRRPVLAAFLMATLGCVGGWAFGIDPLAWKTIEFLAMVAAVASVGAIALLNYRTSLMNFHMAALAFFAQGSAAFLLAEPWTAMWWYAHAVWACGATILGYAVATAYYHGRAFETVFNDTVFYKHRTRELSQLNKTLVNEIEERRKAEERADQFRREAERSNRMKDEFLASLSHELRTPANVILGFSELLESQELTQSEQTEAARAINRNAKAQADLINQLLDLSRIITGRLELRSEKVTLDGIVKFVGDSVQLTAMSKDIGFDIILPERPILVWGDTNRLRQIVWHLISNALKFTPMGGKISLSLARDDLFAEIRVRDNGQGISPDYAPHLFEKFSQQDGSRTRKHGGLGLGLSIVRHLTEMHGGSVRAESDGLGCGACFIVRIPLMKEDVKDEGVSPLALKPLNGLSILVVDDAPDALVLAGAILKRYGAVVVTAGSASEALARLRTFHPDVVLSDISMPEEDGYTLIKKIRQLNEDWAKKVPAAALTAFTDENDRRAALQAGFQVHIPKPIETQRLIEGIHALREKAAAADSIAN